MYVYIDIYLYMHVYVSEIWSAVSAAQSASCSPRNDTPCHLQASRQLLYNYRKRKCFYYVLIQTEDVRLHSRKHLIYKYRALFTQKSPAFFGNDLYVALLQYISVFHYTQKAYLPWTTATLPGVQRFWNTEIFFENGIQRFFLEMEYRILIPTNK